MSIEAYKAAWAADLKHNDKIVLLAIAEFASVHNGYTCTAANETLAGMVGISVRAIRDRLRSLEAAGYVETTINHGRNLTNIYNISKLVTGVCDYKKPEASFRYNKVKPEDKPEATDRKPEATRAKTGSQLPPNRIKPNKPYKPDIHPARDPFANLTPPQKQLAADLQRMGISDLIWPLAFVLQDHCLPVGVRNLAENVETLFGYDATPEEIEGVCNGYWSAFGIGESPYPKQVTNHLNRYRKWADQGKPAPKARGKPTQKMTEPKGYATLRSPEMLEWLNE